MNNQNTQTTQTTAQPADKKGKIRINKDICIRCGTCAAMYPNYFKIKDDGEVTEIEEVEVPEEEKQAVVETCPSGAIYKADK